MTSPRPAEPRRRPGGLKLLAVLATLLLAGIAAGCSSGDSKDDGASGGTSAAPTTTVPQTVTGTPLVKFTETEGDPAVGETIPTITGGTLDGEPITIGAEDDKAKVIVFVAHWCPHCQREVPKIVEHLKDTPMPSDVELYAVSTSMNPNAPNYPPKAWLDKEGWPTPVLSDNDLSAANAYGLSSFPYFVVADASGKVVIRGSGELTMDQFDALVKAAQTGKSPV